MSIVKDVSEEVGVDVDDMMAIVGRERVLYVVICFVSTILPTGRYECVVPGRLFVLGHSLTEDSSLMTNRGVDFPEASTAKALVSGCCGSAKTMF